MDYFDKELVRLDQKVANFTSDTSHKCMKRLMRQLDILEPRTMRFILGVNRPKFPSHYVMYNLAMLDRINDILNYITQDNKTKKIKWLRTYNNKYKCSPYEYMYSVDQLDYMFLIELRRYYRVKARRNNRPKTD